MNAVRTVVRKIATSVPKQSATTTKRDVHPSYFKVHDKYRYFQIDDGLLVHQKGGTPDHVLFFLTVVVNAVGLVMAGDVIYRLAFNKK